MPKDREGVMDQVQAAGENPEGKAEAENQREERKKVRLRPERRIINSIFIKCHIFYINSNYPLSTINNTKKKLDCNVV